MSTKLANATNPPASTPGGAPKKTMKVEGTFADSWKPEEGDATTITGVYLGMQKAESETGPFNAYHIKCNDGRRLSVAGAGLDTIMPQIPRKTEVTIAYGGKERKGKGMMKMYDVQVPEGTVLLDPFDTDDEE